MIELSERPAKSARATVARWFATLPAGPVFLDGKGRAIPLALDLALALRATAEARVREAAVRLEWRAVLAMIGTVVVVIASQWFAASLPDQNARIVREIAYVLYMAHAVWAVVEAIRYDRTVRRLRADLAYDLRGHTPLPAAVAGGATASNVVFGVLAAVALAVAMLTLLAEVGGHHGFDLLRLLPGWLPLALVALIYLLALIAKLIDRRRGIGVLRPAQRRYDGL